MSSNFSVDFVRILFNFSSESPIRSSSSYCYCQCCYSYYWNVKDGRGLWPQTCPAAGSAPQALRAHTISSYSAFSSDAPRCIPYATTCCRSRRPATLPSDRRIHNVRARPHRATCRRSQQPCPRRHPPPRTHRTCRPQY